MPAIAMQDLVRLPDDTKTLAYFLSRVFRKVVRLVIGSVSLPALVDILKAIYVDEAEKKLIREGSKPTKSALALMTGLDTRIVTQVMDQNLESTIQNQSANPENTLIDMWTSDPYFQNPKDGTPGALPIGGKGRSFQGLVLRSIGRNITVKTVIDRLLDSGNIELIPGDVERVRLVSMIYSPISDDRAKQTEVGFIEASRVLSAVIHNMLAPVESRVPQQGRWTYRLAPDKYPEFRNRARELLDRQIKQGEDLLEEFEEPKKQPGQLTVGIGWYQWSDQEPEEEGE